MQTILVTGGAGYIGSHTVRELIKNGIKVVVLDNLTTGHREAVGTQNFYEGDIADSVMVKTIIKEHHIRSVIHLASKSQVSESLAKPELYFYENTVKSFTFMQAAIEAGVKYFVFSSTAAVYGLPENIPIKEETMPVPINPYGASKRMIEEYLEWIGKVHGIGWIALRYFNAAGASLDGILGEDHHPESHLIPLIMHTSLGLREKLFLYGDDYDTEDGTCIRDYVHVVDLAQAHILALRSLIEGLPSQALNVGTGRGASVMKIIKKSEEITGTTIKIETKARRVGDPHILVADNSAIYDAVGWKPSYSDIETILSSAWRWHHSHPYGYSQYITS
ncbi:MAG: UDP-glucose 4-epimerase GalE [Syntrophomonas sp.]|nr:UDP-glucose 4-epimerase GalE [Syntrophomonas sp.]